MDAYALHLEDRLHQKAFCGKLRVEYGEPEAVTCKVCLARLSFFRSVRAALIERGAWPLTLGAFALDTRFGRITVNTTTAFYGWIACRFLDPEKTNSRAIVHTGGMANHHFGVSVDFDPGECSARFCRWLDQLCPTEGWAGTVVS